MGPKVMSPAPQTPKVMSPEPQTEMGEKGQLDAAIAKSERRQAILQKMEQIEASKPEEQEKKFSEDEIKEMVAKVEGKCKTVSGDIADMAMSEQYLRTKQALLMAKRKNRRCRLPPTLPKLGRMK